MLSDLEGDPMTDSEFSRSLIETITPIMQDGIVRGVAKGLAFGADAAAAYLMTARDAAEYAEVHKVLSELIDGIINGEHLKIFKQSSATQSTPTPVIPVTETVRTAPGLRQEVATP